ncbi:enoyl-CoA hydratase-related protein [Lentibacillus salinarum]|uniref:Enoyl-CoA hydratase-related protein n=1 Tax=Lentibacillus salinarum TaxID=446820 RepID=A0ABW3ZRL4_9BACI
MKASSKISSPFLSFKDVSKQADHMAKQILASPITSMLKTKNIYHGNNIDTLKYYLEAERNAQWDLRQEYERQKGVQAFMEKRKPDFRAA